MNFPKDSRELKPQFTINIIDTIYVICLIDSPNIAMFRDSLSVGVKRVAKGISQFVLRKLNIFRTKYIFLKSLS